MSRSTAVKSVVDVTFTLTPAAAGGLTDLQRRCATAWIARIAARTIDASVHFHFVHFDGGRDATPTT